MAQMISIYMIRRPSDNLSCKRWQKRREPFINHVGETKPIWTVDNVTLMVRPAKSMVQIILIHTICTSCDNFLCKRWRETWEICTVSRSTTSISHVIHPCVGHQMASVVWTCYIPKRMEELKNFDAMLWVRVHPVNGWPVVLGAYNSPRSRTLSMI